MRKKFDFTVLLLYILLQIALEVGQYNNCNGLQTYADIKDVLSLYKHGLGFKMFVPIQCLCKWILIYISGKLNMEIKRLTAEKTENLQIG